MGRELCLLWYRIVLIEFQLNLGILLHKSNKRFKVLIWINLSRKRDQWMWPHLEIQTVMVLLLWVGGLNVQIIQWWDIPSHMARGGPVRVAPPTVCTFDMCTMGARCTFARHGHHELSFHLASFGLICVILILLYFINFKKFFFVYYEFLKYGPFMFLSWSFLVATLQVEFFLSNYFLLFSSCYTGFFWFFFLNTKVIMEVDWLIILVLQVVVWRFFYNKSLGSRNCQAWDLWYLKTFCLSFVLFHNF